MTIPAACQTYSDRVTSLQGQIADLQAQLTDVPIFRRGPLLAKIQQLDSQLAVAQAQLTQCIANPPPVLREANLLSVTAQAHVESINSDGSVNQVSMGASINNVSSEAVTIAHALTLLCGAGGFVNGVLKRVPDGNGNPGSFFGFPQPMGAGTTWVSGTEVWGFGASDHNRIVHALRAVGPVVGGNQDEQKIIAQAGAQVDGGTTWANSLHPSLPLQAPAPLSLNWPVSIGLMGPIQVFDVSKPDANGIPQSQRWLQVVGQIVNLAGGSLTPNSVAISLTAGGFSYFNQAAAAIDAPSSGDDGVTRRFFFSQPLPANTFGFTQAQLTVTASYTLDGVHSNVTHTETVDHLSIPRVRAPLDVPAWMPGGALHFGNGVAASGWTGHNGSYTQRYAYDLVFRDSAGNFTVPGVDTGINQSAYCWNAPILAVADGVVVFAGDVSRDHAPGQSSAGFGDVPNVIVIQHAGGGYYSLYAHVQHQSFMVRAGDSVAQGQPIGLVGDNDGSSGPHLHFVCFTCDATGVMQCLPVKFLNVKYSGRWVADAPCDGLDAQTSLAWPVW